MSLTDVVSHMDLTIYPELALVLFIGVFVSVAWKATRTPRVIASRHAALPLEEGSAARGEEEADGVAD